MELHEKLRQIRVSKNWSQREMGEALGISQQVYANYEAGKNKKFSEEIVLWIQENFVKTNTKNISKIDKDEKIVALSATIDLVILELVRMRAKLFNESSTDVYLEYRKTIAQMIKQHEGESS